MPNVIATPNPTSEIIELRSVASAFDTVGSSLKSDFLPSANTPKTVPTTALAPATPNTM
jgi:hypothetical protein